MGIFRPIENEKFKNLTAMAEQVQQLKIPKNNTKEEKKKLCSLLNLQNNFFC